MAKWSGRGESIFIKLPRIGSMVYDSLMRGSPMQLHYEEIAKDVTNRLPTGRLLDIGTGPGRLLGVIHQTNPTLELYGLDISDAMIQQAQKNLHGMGINLHQGNIRHTDFPDGYFDLVICSGSFYLWDQPEEGLQEVYRILKSGKTACLYECDRESDRQALQAGLRKNVQHLNILSRIIGPLAIRQALDAAYSKTEITNIIKQTPFASSFSIEDISLSGLAIWVRVGLSKESGKL
jgi:ubiquinone/menaquinone biosynthesis C-methylase UbiE